jgi:aerobic carbon-monoxide dehydrogenase small subunit
MSNLRLTVNGRPVAAAVEPRTHLADFLRENLLLTGTHLGCEQGVCGACTVLIDGAPARSCITYPLACEGAEITTIEGLDDDEVTRELRAAFSREHGLQCGYCTPGMLVSARDIVTRLPDADERRVRLELSGNLCRCTGYLGIVRAVCAVLDERRRNLVRPAPPPRPLGPVGSGHARALAPAAAAGPGTAAPARAAGPPDEQGSQTAGAAPLAERAPQPDMAAVRPAPASGATLADEPASQTGIAAARAGPATVLRQSFTVDHPRERVFAFFGRLEEVVACMPGAALTQPPQDGHLQGRLRVRLGPIAAVFAGEANVERDPARQSGVIRGQGRDARTGSSAIGEVSYVLVDERAGAATRVEIEIGYALRGALAQFGRPAIVNDLAERLTAAFARNVEARLSGHAEPSAATAASELDAGSLILSVIRTRIRRFFARLLGR